MKRILLSFLFLATVFLKLHAQSCDLTFNNLTIDEILKENTTNSVSGLPNCKYTFNASFDIGTNSGFKYLFFHSWLASDYPSTSIFDCSSNSAQDPGTSAQLGTVTDQPDKSFLDLGFINLNNAGLVDGVEKDVTSFLAATYLHDATVKLINPADPNNTGIKAFVTKNGNVLHFDIQNVTVILDQPCGNQISVKSDIWGSNSNANDPKAQCYICGLGQTYNDPAIAGFKVCSTPRTYNLGITTLNPNDVIITYKVYIDVDGSSSISPDDVLSFTSAPITISSTQPFSVTNATYPYNPPLDNGNKDIIILVEGATLTNDVSTVFEEPQGCIPLPVHFKSFNATRATGSNVSVTWITASEQNSKGFNVQKNVGGEWKTIAFVASKADGGNSSSDLSYSYKDLNQEKGITQYRVQQVDLDGKFTYTDIRAIRGEGEVGKVVVYPNPSVNGKLNVVFEDNNALRDVYVSDMQGKIIRSYRNISNNILVIEKLASGFYTIRITNRNTAASSVEKVVVK